MWFVVLQHTLNINAHKRAQVFLFSLKLRIKEIFQEVGDDVCCSYVIALNDAPCDFSGHPAWV